MQEHGTGADPLAQSGLTNLGNIYWNLSTASLYEEVVRRREGWISHLGPLVVHTGHHTGRSPNDKFIVKEPASEAAIAWGKVNRPMSEEKFRELRAKLCAFFQGRDAFVQNLYAGADPHYQIPVRVITDYAWHNLFTRNLLLRPEKPVMHTSPETFTIIDSPRFHALPEVDGTNSEVFVVISFAERLCIIGGTSYAGEIKKAVFTVLNYLLPERNVLPMHCSANLGKGGDTALFFGLSGTGKTTLSADPERTLIGDDEHGWSEHGIFNFEGGCYAKVIRLSSEAEPDIYATTRTFGTVLENVAIDSMTRRINLDDAGLTENTRAAYPLSHIRNHSKTGLGDHPKNVIMLTCDALGVMPPIAKLTSEQAMYHFLSGYTASKVRKHGTKIWLVNTGWSGGPYGVGSRMKIAYTRAMIRAAVSGALASAPTVQDPIFGLHVPTTCPDVPEEMLNPRTTWKDKEQYDAKARELAGKFKKNFEQFAASASEEIRNAGPR